MSLTLVAGRGRKYLSADERARFLDTVCRDPRPAVQSFALSLAYTGARISEALALRAGGVDLDSSLMSRAKRR